MGYPFAMKCLHFLIERRLLPAVSTDSLRLMAGADEFEPEPVDAVVYR